MIENHRPLCSDDWVHSYVNWLASHLKWYKMVGDAIADKESFSFTVHVHKGEIGKMNVNR